MHKATRNQPKNRKLDKRSAWGKRVRRLAILSVIVTTTGCSMLKGVVPTTHDTKQSYHDNYGLRIEYPEVKECQTPVAAEAKKASEPLVLQDPADLPSFDMTLQEAVQLAVQQSPVLRNIGGTIVSSNQGTQTIYDPALTAASPQFGTEAALAAFDAQFAQQLFWTKTDQPNNVDPAGFTAAFTNLANEGTGAVYSGDLSKRTAQGATFSLRHVVNYNYTNQPFRAFQSDFVGWVEAEWRQPLMQGAGTEFNRIAGPNNIPGQYNGVLIARVNEDVALADFEAAMVNLVADVEQAYWDLATAYRVLEATLKGRASALQTFQYQQVRLEVGAGRSDEEAQAQSQYYQFQAQVESALGGNQGLYQLEQRLRYLVGLTATDGRLIKPVSKPTDAPIIFDWDSALGQAMDRRVEIRRQKFNIKRREMELRAAKLNRRPRLDFLGQYRWRGLGDHLIGDTDAGFGNSLYQSITDGNFQEWQAGMEMNFPVGLRAASVAVAHAKLNLARERALLSETELRISHDLSDSARQVRLTHQLLETNYNRYLADLKQVEVLERRYRDGSDNINFLLQAQRQVINSETDFYRALANYNLAIRDLHRQKGSLLAYNQVAVAEGAWNKKAQQDANRIGKFLTPDGEVTAYRPPAITKRPFNPSAVQGTIHESSTPMTSLSTPTDATPIPSEAAETIQGPPVKEVPADKEPGVETVPPAPKDPLDLDYSASNKMPQPKDVRVNFAPSRPASVRFRGMIGGSEVE